jgi:hypothetical protein
VTGKARFFNQQFDDFFAKFVFHNSIPLKCTDFSRRLMFVYLLKSKNDFYRYVNFFTTWLLALAASQFGFNAGGVNRNGCKRVQRRLGNKTKNHAKIYRTYFGICGRL